MRQILQAVGVVVGLARVSIAPGLRRRAGRNRLAATHIDPFQQGLVVRSTAEIESLALGYGGCG